MIVHRDAHACFGRDRDPGRSDDLTASVCIHDPRLAVFGDVGAPDHVRAVDSHFLWRIWEDRMPEVRRAGRGTLIVPEEAA